MRRVREMSEKAYMKKTTRERKTEAAATRDNGKRRAGACKCMRRYSYSKVH